LAEPRPWETVESKLVLDGGPWLQVWSETVRLPSGRTISPFYRYQKSEFVSIFALDGNSRVLVERRYRHGPRTITLDLPAGYIEPGEEAMATAARELVEETGYEADTWNALGTFTTDGNGGGSKCHVFLARGARKVAEPAKDETEEAEILLLPIAEVRQALEDGKFATLTAAATLAQGLLAVRT
jgi:ADP-ribose pyrophosphatase